MPWITYNDLHIGQGRRNLQEIDAIGESNVIYMIYLHWQGIVHMQGSWI